jgi:acetyltransferase-like isoleucine patch superfamily enzyme
MLRSALKRLAQVDWHGSRPPLLLRAKLALYRNRLHVQGAGNQLRMASIRAHRHLSIDVQGQGNRVELNGELKHSAVRIQGNNNLIRVDPEACLTWTELTILADNSEISIGSKTTILGKAMQPNVLLARGEPSRIAVGQACMFSYGIEVRTSDSHPIHDQQGVRINPSADISFGDQVWVGTRCMVLKGSVMGTGSVLAAVSVLTRPIPAHAIGAGVPAKVIREDIRWTR